MTSARSGGSGLVTHEGKIKEIVAQGQSGQKLS
jgi:hypothetical protein